MAPVTLLISGREMEAKIENISIGGVFVALRDPPPVGTMVKLAIDLGDNVVRAFSRVVWIRLRSKTLKEPVGMGLQFRHFLDEGEGALRNLLAKFEGIYRIIWGSQTRNPAPNREDAKQEDDRPGPRDRPGRSARSS